MLMKATVYLVKACDENPLITTAMIILAMLLFNVFEAQVERLIFGESFEHWLDPIFTAVFILWAAYATFICAQLKMRRDV